MSTLAVIAGIGVAVQVFGQIQGARAEKADAEFNATIAEQEAVLARQEAGAREERQREEDRRILARQRALVGAAGITFEGSPVAVFAESAAQAELDALLIRREGVLRSRSLLIEADIQRVAGRQALAAGILGAGTTLLTGGARIAREERRGRRRDTED